MIVLTIKQELMELLKLEKKYNMNKINEEILEISGINTKPFTRFSYKIPLDKIIDLLTESKEKCKEKGYTNLTLWVSEDTGLVDMSIHGDRDFTEEEKDVIERIQVIARIKDKTSKGLNREDLFNQLTPE